MIIRAENRDYLESINDNLGTALGFKKRANQPVSKEPAIIVFVPLKIKSKWLPKSEVIRDKLEGPDGLWAPLDVVEGGKLKETPEFCVMGKKPEECHCFNKLEENMEVPEAPDELSEALRGWDEQIWVGSQISHWIKDMPGWYSMGTIGAFVRSRGSDNALGLLTNMHVGIEPGQKLYHPLPNGMHLATTDKVIEWVDDQEWYGSFTDEPNAKVRADCAFAKIDPSFDRSNLNANMMGVGQLGEYKPISLDNMSIIGQRVLRVGRTTGLRRGTIAAFGYEFEDEEDHTYYTDLLIVGDNDIPFSTHGDSGSLIVLDNQEMNRLACCGEVG